MIYQNYFQSLKGVDGIDLSVFCLRIANTPYILSPINCSSVSIDNSIVEMLTSARNSHPASFLTFFHATPERTKEWLINVVGKDSSRILFALSNLDNDSLYGYMGFINASEKDRYIEADSIVRFGQRIHPGLMRSALKELVNWIFLSPFFDKVGIRVLSDNPAIKFYKECGFNIESIDNLYERRDSQGSLIELTKESTSKSDLLSERTLTYMMIHSSKNH